MGGTERLWTLLVCREYHHGIFCSMLLNFGNRQPDDDYQTLSLTSFLTIVCNLLIRGNMAHVAFAFGAGCLSGLLAAAGTCHSRLFAKIHLGCFVI
jgi:hypothetical protein